MVAGRYFGSRQEVQSGPAASCSAGPCRRTAAAGLRAGDAQGLGRGAVVDDLDEDRRVARLLQEGLRRPAADLDALLGVDAGARRAARADRAAAGSPPRRARRRRPGCCRRCRRQGHPRYSNACRARRTLAASGCPSTAPGLWAAAPSTKNSGTVRTASFNGVHMAQGRDANRVWVRGMMLTMHVLLENDMDEDVERMSREQLVAEVKRLRQGIRRTATARSRPVLAPPRPVGALPRPRTRCRRCRTGRSSRGCIRYRQSLETQAPTGRGRTKRSRSNGRRRRGRIGKTGRRRRSFAAGARIPRRWRRLRRSQTLGERQWSSEP